MFDTRSQLTYCQSRSNLSDRKDWKQNSASPVTTGVLPSSLSVCDPDVLFFCKYLIHWTGSEKNALPPPGSLYFHTSHSCSCQHNCIAPGTMQQSMARSGCGCCLTMCAFLLKRDSVPQGFLHATDTQKQKENNSGSSVLKSLAFYVENHCACYWWCS